MRLKIGDIAVFSNYTGQIVEGRVVATTNNVYYVIAIDPTKLCSMFSDGLYRFRDTDIMVKSYGT